MKQRQCKYCDILYRTDMKHSEVCDICRIHARARGNIKKDCGCFICEKKNENK